MVRIHQKKTPFMRCNSKLAILLATGIVCAVVLNIQNFILGTGMFYSHDDRNAKGNGNGSNDNGNFNLARDQSFNFFDDMPSEHWNRLRQIASKHEPHKNPEAPLPNFGGPPAMFYQANYEPNFSCLFEQRVGGNGNGDGPKWVCDPHRLIRISEERKKVNPNVPGCLVYSVGSNGDFAFELALQKLLGPNVCEVHIFDFGNYEGTMPKDWNLHYHQWGLAKQENGTVENKPTPGKKFYSIEETIKLLGHENMPAIDVFKIDCEGCEFEIYKEWFSPAIPHLQQVLVEVHATPKDHILDFFDGFQKEGYVTFHKEPNLVMSGNFVEYAFLKLEKDFFLESNNKAES